MTEVIKTQRLVLRRFRREDASRLVDLLNDLDLVRWLTVVPYPYDTDHAIDFINNIAGPSDAFAITLDNNLIGCISLGNQMGYWIEKGSWGHGYVTEAAQAMTARHFRTDCEDIDSGYHLGNERSKAVLSKIGFRPTGRRPAKVVSADEDVIIQEMALSRADWEAAQ
ncbi:MULTISPECIES: GNAT family N-acetyltransferase [unclassified Ruegeria]|uniref:GNAT family N-acetyltransferase n=1 Tax=unclassified Ruegeria TaxID=2625375 RepID=UPI001487DF34|nr:MULTISPECIES: GNAT family protein [unclassified Ruegeria]